MELYVLKNEDGTQCVSKNVDDANMIIGLWKVKSVKFKFVHDIIYQVEYSENPLNLSYDDERKANQVYLLSYALNNYIRRRNVISMFKQKMFIDIIRQMASMSKRKNYITMASVIQHFEQTDMKIDKQVLLEMVQMKLLHKLYHKVMITDKGFEYLTQKKSPTN